MTQPVVSNIFQDTTYCLPPNPWITGFLYEYQQSLIAARSRSLTLLNNGQFILRRTILLSTKTQSQATQVTLTRKNASIEAGEQTKSAYRA